jgi:hypothetical protein
MHRMLMSLVATAVVGITIPAHATQNYPYCERTFFTGGSPDCSFITYQQCQASISGVGGDCIRNPRAAYQAAPTERRKGRRWKRAY